MGLFTLISQVFRRGHCLAFVSVNLMLAMTASAKDPFPVVLVDKKTNRVHLGLYQNGGMQISKTYHATLGKVLGDKVMTDDKKTPEGVYFFTAKRTQPALLKKFGVMAFPVDYPNVIDKLEKKTGFGIMLHATDDPSRLTKDYDSDGCVVVDNHQIEEISPSIRLGLTPMIVYPEFKEEFIGATYEPQIKPFFDTWVKAWQTKDIDSYMAAYDESFRGKGMSLAAYKAYKKSLNDKYDRIEVRIDNPRFFHHPKYDVITFTQRYRSFNRNGQGMFESNGTKMLYLRHTEDKNFRILAEEFNHVMED